MPDGYKRIDGERLGFFEDNNGNRHFYQPGNSNDRLIAKAKARKHNTTSPGDKLNLKERMR